MSIVLNSDFVNKYELTLTQFNTSLIDSYIAKYENEYLVKMLGKALYDLFIANLVNGVPTSAIYTTIFNPLYVDTFISGEVESNGIKEMLLGFIYYHYTLDTQQQQTSVGVTAPKSENSEGINLNSISISRFNDNVKSYKTIQSYIQQNSSSYPTFNGKDLKYEYFL
jgi:hypothetical protein